MKIVIVGCGKVGTAIAEQLSEEGHTITVVDRVSERVRKLTDKFDVMGIVGDGSSVTMLTDNDLENIDVFIAVTGTDEINMLSCMFAKKTCNCHVIARVRKAVYNRESGFIKSQMGIDTIINPDRAAAVEISRLLRFPAASKIDTFAGGLVRLVKFELKKECGICGMCLKDIAMQISSDVLICAVERNGNVEIPRGDYCLAEGDIITFLAEKDKVTSFMKKLQLPVKSVKSATLVGGSTICSYLTEDLIQHGIQVKIIERDENRCMELAETYPEAIVLQGDGTDHEFVMSQQLASAEAFVSLTNVDEENVLLALFAKKHSKAKLVTKVNRLEMDDLMENLDVGSVVYPKYMTCDQIVQSVRALKNRAGSNITTLYRLLDDRVEALEFTVSEDSAVTGDTLSRLSLKKNQLICCITRGKEIIIPRGNDRIQVGDRVIVVTLERGLHDIRDILAH